MKFLSVLKAIPNPKKLSDWDYHFGKDGLVKKIYQAGKKLGKKDYVTETFKESMTRLNMKDKDLRDAYKYQSNVFKFWSVMGFFSIVAMIVAIVMAAYTSLLPGLGFLLVAISMCYQTSYRCYCINHRKLGVVEKWKKSGELFPKKYVNKTYDA